MAKKKSSNQAVTKKPSEKWTIDELAVLYSWLDYCVLTLEKGKGYFWGTVSKHLKDAGSIHPDPAQIKRKLKLDWSRYGPVGSIKFDDIYRTGSAHFGLSQDESQKIALALHVLRERPAYQSRHLRGGSKLNEFHSLSYSSLKPSENGSPRTPKQLAAGRTVSSSITPSVVKREIEPAGLLSVKALPSRKRKRKSPTKFCPRKNVSNIQHKPSRSVTIVDDSEEDETTQLSSSGNQHTAFPQDENTESRSPQDREAELETSHSELQSETASEHSRCVPTCNLKLPMVGLRPAEVCCASCKTWQHNSCVGHELVAGVPGEYLCDKCDFGGYQQRLKDFNLQQAQTKSVELRLATAVKEIYELRQQLRQTETNLRNVQTKLTQAEDGMRAQKSIQFQRDRLHEGPNGCQAFEELLQQRMECIESLQIELNDRRRLGHFATLPESCREWFGIELGSEKGVPSLYTDIKQFALNLRIEPLLPASLKQHPDLRLLINEALQSEQDESEASTMEHFQRLGVQGALRSLVICALRLWVFEENLNLDTVSEKSSELLAKYRECIGKQDGVLALRNIDLAAKQAVVQDKHDSRFQATLFAKAEQLAIKFSQVLAPLFSHEMPEVIWDNFSTWAQDAEQWQATRARLIKIFNSALTIKAESYLNIEDYELVIYRPGTKFDKNTMTAEMEGGMPDAFTSHDGRIVRFCVEAAVFSYSRKELRANDSVCESIIPSQNFVRKSQEERRMVQPLVKAVVILTNDI